jgi:sarcosine oxidase subunit beta
MVAVSEPQSTVVIGAGVIGSAIALELSRRGRPVVVLDKGPAAGHGSTAASSAIVRCTYSTVPGTTLAYEGLGYWHGWAQHVDLPAATPLTRFVECGIMLLDDESGIVAAVRPSLDAVGVAYEWWDADELALRYPVIGTGALFPPRLPSDPEFWREPTDRIAGALFTPEAGYITDPMLAAQNLADAAIAAGAEFRFRAEVEAIETADGRVAGVSIGGGERIGCETIVNAAGPHSARVNALAGLAGADGVSTRPLRQQVGYGATTDSRFTSLPIVGDLGSGIYVKPELGAGILFGSTEPECDPLVWLDDPDQLDVELDPDEWEAQTLRVARRLPEFGTPHVRRGVVGLYDVSEDWRPIIDRTDVEGYFTAIGTSGNQFKNAAIIGFCLADLIEAVESGHDHDRDPLVVTGPHRGLPIDLGAFARGRRTDGGAQNVIG